MFEFTIEDPFIISLACAALTPALRSILVFDAPYPVLRDIAEILTQMLEAVTEQTVEQGSIGTQQDDDVWGSLPLPDFDNNNAAVTHIFKLFSRKRNAKKIQLLTIANLTHLSLPMARTCTMLVGADIAHLERNGEHDQWQLQQCWLASCSRQEVGAISPHLLDRFAIRLSWQPAATYTHQKKIEQLRAFFHSPLTPDTLQLPREFLQHITDAVQRHVDFTQAAALQVMNYTPIDFYYPRRELALARLAQALARLNGDPQVTIEHVDKAAGMLGIGKIKNLEEDKQSSTVATRKPTPVGQEQSVQSTSITQPVQTVQQESSDTFMVKTQAASTPDPLALKLSTNPYPEDEALVEREASSLKVPSSRFSTTRSDRGPIFGVEQADTLQDLAIVSTLQTAVMFQEVRKVGQEKKHRLLIEKSDLRRYRRGFISEHMLLLLLDYTCLESCNWQEALLPYLQEAYADRASITIVKVGAADASDLWRADTVSGRNILVPRIETALEAQRGKATPLAHGLEIALQTLYHVLQQGRSAVQQVTFVVISDGRGNIPLETSLKKETKVIVTREGIDDALHIAQMIRGMKRVESIVLNPQPRYYVQLPRLLAQALGATIEDIPTRFSGSEDVR